MVGVSDSSCEVKLGKGKSKKIREFKKNQSENWETESQTLVQQYLAGSGIPGSGGVVIGDIQIRLKLKPLQGMKTSHIDGSTKKIFGKEEAQVPLQMVLWKAPAPDPRFIERGPLKLQDRFPIDSNVLITKGKYRGCKGTILGVADKDKMGIKLTVIPPEPPFGLAIARTVTDTYISAFEAAKLLRLKTHVFLRIAGSVSCDPGRYDLGLNLTYKDQTCVNGYSRVKNNGEKNKSKDAKKGAWDTGDSLLVVGSSRNTEEENDRNAKRVEWEFTPQAIRLLAAYRQQFPQIFSFMNKFSNERFYDAKKVFGPSGEAMLPKVREWLDNNESAKLPRTPSSTKSMPRSAAVAVERASDVRLAAQEQSGPLKEVNVRLPPSAIFLEGSILPTSVVQTIDYNDGSPPELGDRIANLCANGIVFGARGTVVSVHDSKSGCVEVIMDEEFIGGSTLQGSCSNFRGKLCVWAHMLKISAADSKEVIEKILPAKTQKVKGDEQLSNEKKAIVSAQRNNGVRQNISPVKTATPLRNSLNIAGRENKQAGWKEAKPPQGSSTGFKNINRSVKYGLQAWRQYVSTGKKPSMRTKHDTASAGLKSLLGVTADNGTLASQTSISNGKIKSVDATAALKAKLGLGNKMVASSTKPPEQAQQSMDDLMNIPLPAAPPSAPTTAPIQSGPQKPSATKALEEMMMKTSISPQIPPVHQAPQSSFNFTYVQEGEVPQSLTSQPKQVPSFSSTMVPPPMVPMNFQGGVVSVMNAQPAPFQSPSQQPSSSKPSTIPRAKKDTEEAKDDSMQGIVPSAVVTKLKK